MAKHNSNPQLIKQLTNRLREIRKEKGIKQYKVLEDTGIHLGRLETQSVKNVTITTLKNLCTYYDIKLERLLKNL